MSRLAGFLDRGLTIAAEDLAEVRRQAQRLGEVDACLKETAGTAAERQVCFEELTERWAGEADPWAQDMAERMGRWEAGLFVGSDKLGLPSDNLDLERWFRLPKGHERRIHGRKHAGVRLVQEGATRMPTLDAHKDREEPFKAEELLGYKDAKPPKQEQEAMHRRQAMRRARSKKQRPILLAELERRYLAAP